MLILAIVLSTKLLYFVLFLKSLMLPPGLYPDEQHPTTASPTGEDVRSDGRHEAGARRG